MREYLPYEAHRKRISTHLQPFAGRRVFNLGTDAQYRHQKNHQLQNTRQKCVIQIDRIVKPRIPDRVCIDHDRLELRHDLVFSIAMRQPRLKPDRSTC